MHSIAVQITGYVDDSFPGSVSCALSDAQGHTWRFVEKLPIVTSANLDAGSAYPHPGEIRCQVVSRFVDPSGRSLVRIDTGAPDGVESTDGNTLFEVLAEQLLERRG